MTDVVELDEAPEMVTLAVAGDTAAFGEIYEKHYGLVFRFVFRRVGNHAVAEDLAADVFVRGLKHCHKFVWQGTDIAAWLLAITRNVIADYYRSARYRREVLSGGGFEHADHSDMFEAHPDEIVIAHMMNREVISLLPLISDEQRAVLECRFLRELSLLETCEVLGKNEGQVKALQYRGVRSLARAYQEEQEKRHAAAHWDGEL